MKSRLLFIIAAVAIILYSQKASYGQVPNMGTTTDFVLFSSVGAVSNTGISHLTGHVGTNGGSSTGFGNVNGVMHDGDPASIQCAADLLVAYGELDAAIPTLFPGILLGNGDTLTAGVYGIPAPATLNLVLTLDGEGDPDALFIFQIDGAFSTNANSKIKLINGAQACNVFWKVEGLVSLATGTTMRGTILANNAAILMSTGDTLEGRALTTNGAITVDGVLAYTPTGCGSILLTGPVVPDLGSAACYTIFSSNGALSNTPITSVIGDVGNNGIGAITGWTPADVTGTLHLIQDASTIQCASDLSDLYLELNALIPDIELLYPAQFGNNLVLTPHVYLLDGLTTFTDSLYLDAQNNPNGVFVIKIVNGGLATSTYSKVKLINGAQSKNVFWLVEGAVNINNYSVFRGTIVVPVGAISLVNTGVVLDGRAFSLNGSITTAGLFAANPPNTSLINGPTDQIACEGDSAVLWIEATGTNLTFQWKKGTDDMVNGGNVSGATSDSLVFYPVSLTDASSDYYVIVSSSCCPNDTSMAVSLVVNTGPEITFEPTDQSVCAGDSAGFTVTATGVDLTYQWRKGDVDLVTGPSIVDVTSATLVINPVSISDISSEYNVIITGSCTPPDTSIDVSLSVDSVIVIVTQPISQSVCPGDSISFIVQATGNNLTYQWRNGNVNLVNGPSISGVQSDTLTIDPVIVSDTSSYYNVIISGLCSPNDTSDFVSLSMDTTIIITQPLSQTVCSGDSISFIVDATGTGLTFQWRNGNVNLVNGPGISGAQSDTLTIDPVFVSDTSSFYNVIISSLCSPNDTSNFVSLSVDSLMIITQPLSQSVCLGDSVSFIVAATGNGLSYQWRRGITNLIDGPSVFGATTDTLTIFPVSALDAATDYNVIVTGSCAPDATSMNASLEVGVATVITTAPVNQTVCEGDSVSFFVVASGSNLTYQWRRGTVDLVNGGNISGATSDTLTINPATLSDVATNYNVVISGGCSTVNSMDTVLKSAGNFGILASTAITSTGFSEIHNMDVGISPGFRSSITGFPPAIVVNGDIYASDDVAPPGVAALLIQAKQDLTDAYLFAEGATAPAPATVAGDQGGTTLAPGIYKSTSTLLIQFGDLTLDAQGDSNAVWIFQIASDFTTIGGAGGNVILTGGAQAKNVYWQVGSSATIGNGTSFKGNILALMSITMNTGSSIDGRLLARNGAVVLSGTNIINEPSDSVTNNISITSINVSLTVNTALVIITGPTNQTACEGDSVTFSVVANGSGLTYQWRKGLNDLTNTGNVSGAQSANLTINPAYLSDTSSYYNVVISGGCNLSDTTIYVTLTVDTATTIIAEPIDQTVCEGDMANFSVSVLGTALTYQWRKGSVNMIDGGTISGATTATLTINPVNISDIGSDYNVIITGLCLPNDTSVNVSLDVDSAIFITTQPANQSVCAGNPVTFSVVATGSGLTYQWRKGLNDLTNTGNVSGAQSANLTINPAYLSDTSSYYNVVISGGCTLSDTTIYVTLTVDTATTIIAEPIDQTVCEGDMANFSVSVLGSALTYQWRKGSVNMIDGGTISGATTATLTINPVNISDIGSDYNVIVTGICLPEDTSDNASLTVELSPIAVATSNSPVCTDSTVYFYTQLFTGGTYLWTGPNGFSSTLQNPVIFSAGEAYSGVYSLSVSINGCTSALSTTTLLVITCGDFFIPEGFSPNGDLINDYFVIRGIENFHENTIVIYNRWGDLVFEASPYLNTWDGKYLKGLMAGGDDLPVGTYFYVLDLGNGSEVYKGTIYLNR